MVLLMAMIHHNDMPITRGVLNLFISPQEYNMGFVSAPQILQRVINYAQEGTI